ncbi:hypothetical protein [Georgenia subflava]|uniref:Alkaline phosphatase family protein n=1 Tax=Georgenia subflava TaxID=1622177 RepID=A0A6N7EFV3_9MICO|nr:hypothetical protein [Georgenia subflava]MPV36063.1 hypothetical protein [Georgenia subflava]
MSTRRQRQRRVVLVVAAIIALGMLLPFVLPMLPAGATERHPAGQASTATSARAGGTVTAAEEAGTEPAAEAIVADVDAPLVVIGTTGLRWEDLTALATPNLWRLAESGAAANMVVRSVRSSTCPADGWLALSAGRRSADVPMEEYGTCRELGNPAADGAVPGWPDYLDAAAADAYDASPGMLGDLLTEQDVPSVAVGPGAAIALSTGAGVVAGDHTFAATSSARLNEQVAEVLPGHALAVVDVGSIRDRNRPLVDVGRATPDTDVPPEPDPAETPTAPPDEAWLLRSPERSEQVAAIDARVGAVLDAVEQVAPDATVVVASLADSGTQSLMQLLVAEGPALDPELPADGALLNTRSTRQPGMVQSTDLTPTVLGMLGVDAPAGLAGAPLGTVDDGRTGPARVAHLVDVGIHSVEIRPLVGPFYSALVLGNLLLYGVVTLGLNRKFLDRAATRLDRYSAPAATRAATALRSHRPAAALRAIRAVSVTVGAIPIASYLANLLPWWRAESPGTVLYATTVLVAAAVAAVALLGPWRRHLLAPVVVVAGLTALVLAVDVLTGATLQLSSLMGVTPQVGGRFYGFNNSSFSLFAASTILVAGCVAEPLVRRSRRYVAATAVLVIGVVAVALDGLPTIGADFGGPPALIPGFLVLALLALGVRLTWRRIVVVLGVTAVLAVSFSVIDWLRPPAERSHLGRFIETVLDGGLWAVVGRKLSQNLQNLFGSTLTFLAIGGIVVVVVLLTRPLRNAARSADGGSYGWLVGRPGSRIDRDWVMLRPVLVALAVTFTIAFAVNDSGVVLPAIGIALSVPLLVAVVAGWLLSQTAGAASQTMTPAGGAGAPETDAVGPDTGADGPDTGADGPDAGADGPKTDAVGPETGTVGPATGTVAPEGGEPGRSADPAGRDAGGAGGQSAGSAVRDSGGVDQAR